LTNTRDRDRNSTPFSFCPAGKTPKSRNQRLNQQTKKNNGTDTTSERFVIMKIPIQQHLKYTIFPATRPNARAIIDAQTKNFTPQSSPTNTPRNAAITRRTPRTRFKQMNTDDPVSQTRP